MDINTELDQFIYSFHMPLFFIISGMTAKTEKNMIEFTEKRIRRIIVPYIVFALIFTNIGYRNWLYCLYGSRKGLLLSGSLTSLWFLPCLFSADFVFHLILKYCRDRKYIIVASLLSAIAGIAIKKVFPIRNKLPFSFDIAFAAVPFLLIGYLLKNDLSILKQLQKKSYIALGLSAAMLGILCFTCCLNLPPSASVKVHHVEMAIGSYGNVLLFYFNAVLGSFSILLFSKAADGKLKLLECFGRCTITCLVIHRSLIAAADRICSILQISPVIENLAALLLTIAVTFIGEIILRRYAPNLVGMTELSKPILSDYPFAGKLRKRKTA